MEAMEAILTRRSVRRFRDEPLRPELIEQVLRAGMSAPSARDARPWRFVVIDDRSVLRTIGERFPNAEMAAQAPLGILVCGDLALERSQGYWVIDCAAAAENMLLAAHALGAGGVWTGVYPREQRVEGLRGMLGIPDGVIPHSLLLFGYPDETPSSEDRYQPDRVSHNHWGTSWA